MLQSHLHGKLLMIDVAFPTAHAILGHYVNQLLRQF